MRKTIKILSKWSSDWEGLFFCRKYDKSYLHGVKLFSFFTMWRNGKRNRNCTIFFFSPLPPTGWYTTCSSCNIPRALNVRSPNRWIDQEGIILHHCAFQSGFMWNTLPHRNYLTLILLTWRKWWASNNASKWQMGFNSAFKGLIYVTWRTV
jgi:hypothetical protein